MRITLLELLERAPIGQVITVQNGTKAEVDKVAVSLPIFVQQNSLLYVEEKDQELEDDKPSLDGDLVIEVVDGAPEVVLV